MVPDRQLDSLGAPCRRGRFAGFLRLEFTPHLSRILALIGVLYALVLVAGSPSWTVDDAYITFRYARNLALHGELNWNVAEEPVEGYTGIAWPVMLAGAIRLGASPIDASRVFGVVCWLLSALFLERALKETGVAHAARAAAVLLWLCPSILALHSLGGLETQAFAAAITGSLWVLLRAMSRGRLINHAPWVFGAALLCGLVRPEGVLVAPVVLVVGLLRLHQTNRSAVRAYVLRFGMFYMAPACAYFLIRWNYYGVLLPNPFYAKTQSAWNAFGQIGSLWAFLLDYACYPAGACLMAGAGALASRIRSSAARQDRPRNPNVAPALCSALFLSLAWMLLYLRTDPIMNVAHRYYAPLYPLLLLVLGVLFQCAWSFVEQIGRRGVRVAIGGAGACVLLLQSIPLEKDLLTYGAEAARYACLLEDEHVQAGIFLRETVPPSDWLAVHIDAGAIPYESGLPTIDLGALNDEFLAQHKPSAKEQADYFYSKRPAALALTSWHETQIDPRFAGGKAIVEDPRFADYVLTRVFSSPANVNYRQLIYFRRDLHEKHARFAGVDEGRSNRPNVSGVDRS